jgi:hypothetical protein
MIKTIAILGASAALLAGCVASETREPTYSSKHHDAKVAGTSYHATGNIPCSMGGGAPTGSCPFGVTRQGGGTADVTVTKPDGRTRVIIFQNGRAIAANTSEADPGKFSASKQADLNIIKIGQERYEIPDAVVSGG